MGGGIIYYLLLFSLSWLSTFSFLLLPRSDSRRATTCPPGPAHLLLPASSFSRAFFLLIKPLLFYFFLKKKTFLSSFLEEKKNYRRFRCFFFLLLSYRFPLAPQGLILSTSLTKGSFLFFFSSFFYLPHPRANFGQGY